MPVGKDNLTAAEVGRRLGLSVHTLSDWRQRGQGPRTIQAGARSLYRRADVENWLGRVSDAAERMTQALRDLIKGSWCSVLAATTAVIRPSRAVSMGSAGGVGLAGYGGGYC